jgi:Fe-S-cluster containining protein
MSSQQPELMRCKCRFDKSLTWGRVGFTTTGRRLRIIAMSLLSPDLRVLSCDGCGACCAEQGAPPDYVALRLSPHLAGDPSFADDLVRYRSLSGEPLELLEQYFAERAAGARSEDGVCVWFDASNCNCRFYDLRPSTCRVFELDSPGCHLYRRRAGVPPSGGS